MSSLFDSTAWDQYAESYDALNELRPYSDMLERVSDALSPSKYPLLDAGCGTGNLLAKLVRTHCGDIAGLDSSDAMLVRARAKCPSANILKGDLGQALPFADGTFSYVTCVNALYAVPDPRSTLLELRRILRPGGTLVVVTPKLGYDNGLILKAHCESSKPDSYWRDVHADPERERALLKEAISDRAFAERLLLVARYNRAIARERSFHFFSPDGIVSLFDASDFAIRRMELTYADQNHFLLATKGPG